MTPAQGGAAHWGTGRGVWRRSLARGRARGPGRRCPGPCPVSGVERRRSGTASAPSRRAGWWGCTGARRCRRRPCSSPSCSAGRRQCRLARLRGFEEHLDIVKRRFARGHAGHALAMLALRYDDVSVAAAFRRIARPAPLRRVICRSLDWRARELRPYPVVPGLRGGPDRGRLALGLPG